MAAPSPLLVLPLSHLYLNFGSSLFTGYMLNPHDMHRIIGITCLATIDYASQAVTLRQDPIMCPTDTQ